MFLTALRGRWARDGWAAFAGRPFRLDIALFCLLMAGVFFGGSAVLGLTSGSYINLTMGLDHYEVSGLGNTLAFALVGVLEVVAYFNGLAGRRYRLVLAAGLSLMGLAAVGMMATRQTSAFLFAALITEFIYSSRDEFTD